MKTYNFPYTYLVKDYFLSDEIFEDQKQNYPYEHIKTHCANINATEHQDSLAGNYSAPVINDDVLTEVKKFLSPLKKVFLQADRDHDHFYTNYHYDLKGTSLEVHNDLKGFRWLITSQIYFDGNNQGARLLSKSLKPIERVPENPNMLYSIMASPYSWHDVPELANDKRSILFRVGKKRHRSVAHPNSDNPECWVIVNEGHDDTHYAKLGPRMGNLTEAWLWYHDYQNIYHTAWRDDPTEVFEYAKSKHKTVNVIPSGELVGTGQHIIVDQENYREIADQVFRRSNNIEYLTEAEDILNIYYKSGQHLRYKDIKRIR